MNAFSHAILYVLCVCNISGGRIAKIERADKPPSLFLALPVQYRARQEQRSPHPRSGCVAPHGATAHLHAPDALLAAMIGPRHSLVPIQYAIAGPLLAQAQEQSPQTAEREERLALPDPSLGISLHSLNRR